MNRPPRVSHDRTPNPRGIHGAERHFPAYAHAAAAPERIALRIGEDTRTWSALVGRAEALAAAWLHQCPPATRSVGLVATRTIGALEHLYALILAGIPVVLLDPDATDEEARHAHEAGGVDLLATDKVLRAVEARAHDDAAERTDAKPNDAEQADAAGTNAAPWSADRVLVRVLSSGTTGLPKAIDLTAEQVIFSALGSAARLGSLPSDTWYVPLPWHHVGGVMVLLRGMILGFCAEYTLRFNALHALERLQSGEVTLASFVPVMLERILDAAPVDDAHPTFAPTLRAVLVGGAATSSALLDAARRHRVPIARSWGMSETASQIATAEPGDWDSPLAPLPFARIAQDGHRLVLEGPHVTSGRLVTSDRGTLSARGVTVDGRADDVFISGGENIDPVEIERVVASHSTVRDVLVLGVPSDVWGQRPVAFVSGAGPDEEPALRALCAAALQKYKMPSLFFFVDDIPRNAMGKPSRKLARLWWERHYDATDGLALSSVRDESGAKS